MCYTCKNINLECSYIIRLKQMRLLHGVLSRGEILDTFLHRIETIGEIRPVVHDVTSNYPNSTSVGPTNNPSEGVVGPTSFWTVEATLAHTAERWFIVSPTVAKIDFGPTLAQRRLTGGRISRWPDGN